MRLGLSGNGHGGYAYGPMNPFSIPQSLLFAFFFSSRRRSADKKTSSDLKR